jgi:hypothetical protein
MARQIDTFEFHPDGPASVLDIMERLASAHDGWINFLPGVRDEDVPEPGRAGMFGGVFGTPQAPVSMATWIPAKKPRPNAEATVGIMHPRGRRSIAQLTELGRPLPAGWRVRQDHARRGLIVLVPSSVPAAQVLDWTLEAAAALSIVALTGMFEARVYQPVARSSSAGPDRSTGS